ncbi:MAG: polyphosphate kinase 2 family protein [Bacteroides sp.]|jgi:PPK2 family polyphosphate:nucleotide phosphotransferase|nr:polyphosphate kinase 2 family protein [Bacteroides sp.]
MDYNNEFFFDPSRSLKDYPTDFKGPYERKKEAREDFEKGLERLRALQDKLYAHNRHGVLIILQALDAAGKDGTIKHVMSGVNPQGCQVKSFKTPSGEELDHDFMWRCFKALPERGNIGIFNRSYYEEVLAVRVHPEFLLQQNLPGLESVDQADQAFWETRFKDISNFERYFSNNGFLVLKFFLHVSRKEQKERFLDRINEPAKNWKFTMGDVSERQYFEKYLEAFEDMLKHTSKDFAPWYVIPADRKWFMRLAVCEILVNHLEKLDLKYPDAGPDHLKDIEKARVILENENK